MASSALPATIRTWQYTATGGGLEKNLKLNNAAPIPSCSSTQNLVRNIAASLNPVDYKPAEVPLLGRLLVPSVATPGCDFAGQLVKPAPGSSFTAGQLVFGVSGSKPFAGGTLSEYTSVDDDCFAAVPPNVDVHEAATVGVAGITAYQTIVPHVRAGDHVFINGGSGGTGVFGIQIAKAVGCSVTTTCSTANVDLCKRLGADEVVDYKKGSVAEALIASGVKFDHLVDNVGSDPELYWRCHEFSKKDAVYVMVAGGPTWHFISQTVKRAVLPSFLGGTKREVRSFFAKPTAKELAQIGKWMAEGKVKAVVDQKFAFEDVPKAFERLKTGRTKGKIVIEVASEK